MKSSFQTGIVLQLCSQYPIGVSYSRRDAQEPHKPIKLFSTGGLRVSSAVEDVGPMCFRGFTLVSLSF